MFKNLNVQKEIFWAVIVDVFGGQTTNVELFRDLKATIRPL